MLRGVASALAHLLRRLVPWRRAHRPLAPHLALGAAGEDLAASHLLALGWRILGRNLLLPMGEIDILASEPAPTPGRPETIVLVEVKARIIDPDTPRPPPEAAITRKKQRTLRAMLAHLRRRNHWHSRPARIDVIAIVFPPPGLPDPPDLRHYRNAVDRP